MDRVVTKLIAGRAATIAARRIERNARAQFVHPDNVLESDLRQALLSGFVETIADEGVEVLARAEHQISIGPDYWSPKPGRSPRCKPGPVDFVLRLYKDEVSATARYDEVACETKWASGWAELYDGLWDVLKLAAWSVAEDADRRRRRFVAMLAYVAPVECWNSDSGPGVAAREAFVERDFQLLRFIRENKDLWRQRVVDHKDIGSIPKKAPEQVKISHLATQLIQIGQLGYELRIIGFGPADIEEWLDIR